MNKSELGGWTVGQKSVVGSGAIVLLIAAVAAVGFLATTNLGQRFEILTQNSVIEIEALGDIGRSAEKLAGEAREYVLFGDRDSLAELDIAAAELDLAISTYANIQNRFHRQEVAAGRDYASRLRLISADFQAKSNTLTAMSERDAENEEVKQAGEALEAAEQSLRTAIAAARQATALEMAENIERVETELSWAQILLLVLPFGALVITFLVTYFLNRSILSRLAGLAELARRITAGDLSQSAKVETNDEIGQLAQAFNAMTNRLRENIGNLEERVAERTQQLEAVVGVSQRLTGILDLSDLLRQVVNITKETFDYYHTHIYLLQNDTLVMAEGYGPAGAEMKRHGHSIPVAAPKSLVARAAREGKIITVENVRTDPTWLPNPLLPDTHAEMAVPIKLDIEVVGVLDVQSEKIGGLTQQDETTLETLANQVAAAVRSARLFSQTQEALNEAYRLQQLYTGQAWEKLAITRQTTDYEFHQSTLAPLKDRSTPEALAALQQKRTVNLRIPTVEGQQDTYDANGAALNELHSAVATPLMLRGQMIGVLGIQHNDPERQWTKDEIALIEAVSEQMSLALENARLFEETGRRAGREKIIADVTRKIWASGELEQVMQTAAEQLGAKLDASKVVIRLGTEDQLLAGRLG